MTQAEEAIRRFLGGDADAFTWLVREWEGRVFNLALRMMGNREDAQDVLQETFLSVYRSLGSLRDHASFRTWLYRVTLNHCRARWRSRKAEVSLDTGPDAEESGAPASGLPDPAAVNAGHRAETADLIRKGLAGLSDEHRAAIVLKEYLGLTLEEVADAMECPLSTAKSRLYHGLRGVQKNLERLGAFNPAGTIPRR